MIEHLKAQWLLYVPPGSTLNNSAFCPHSVLMRSVPIAEKTAIISLYDINFLISITETECVYCAVRTEPLNKIQLNLGLKALEYLNFRAVARLVMLVYTYGTGTA